MALFYLIPVMLTGGAGWLFWIALRSPQKIARGWGAAGLGLLVLDCIWLVSFASEGGLGGVAAFIAGALMAGTALIASALLALFLPGWRKLVAVPLVIVFPVALFASTQIGDAYSWERIAEKNGVFIAQALNRYHADHLTYPKTLTELVPTYLDNLREPRAVWGWLYTATQDDFSLGYVYWVDREGYSVCVYSSMVPEWNCLPGSPGPFTIAPTPGP